MHNKLDGGGSYFLTSSGVIMCKSEGMNYSVVESGARMRICSNSLMRSS